MKQESLNLARNSEPSVTDTQSSIPDLNRNCVFKLDPNNSEKMEIVRKGDLDEY